MTNKEQEIADLNAIILQMKDECNAAFAERDKYKTALETLLMLIKEKKATPENILQIESKL